MMRKDCNRPAEYMVVRNWASWLVVRGKMLPQVKEGVPYERAGFKFLGINSATQLARCVLILSRTSRK
jgi:hypothetical protein